MIKRILFFVAFLILAGAGIGFYLWNKPHKKVEDAKGISMTAPDLSKEYATNEKAADAKYLNHAIEVTGTISEVNKNQDGGLMIILETADPNESVQCAMRDKGVNAAKGQNVIIRGFCSGNEMMGVSLTDCVIP